MNTTHRESFNNSNHLPPNAPEISYEDKEIENLSRHSLHDSDTDVEKADAPGVTPEIAVDEPEDTPAKPTTSNDKPYSAFSQREKVLIVLCATLGGMFSPFTSNIYYPALDTISRDLNVSISKVNLSITTYMIFQAIAPTFVSTITDTQGRRPTYVSGFIVYIAANIGLALNKSYAGLLVLRCLQSCGAAGMVTLQQAIIADVVTSAERGKYISITSISSIVAPSVAPIIGGVLSQHLGWHSVFWFLLVLSGVYLVPLLLFLPETSRKLVGDGSTPPPRWNMSLLNVTMASRQRRSNPNYTPPPRPARQPLKWPNPLPVLRLYTQLEYCILLSFAAIAYAAFYGISSSLTVQFSQIYHLNSTYQGLLFLPQALGSIFSAITNSILLDRNYRRHARKLGRDTSRLRQIDMQGFPIERARLEIALPMFALNSIATIAYGWMLDAQIHIAGPVVMLVVTAYTTLAGFNALSVLNIDINRHRAASASAAANLSRCLFGAGMTAVINPMILAMGRGWTFTLTGLVQAAFLPALWICMRYGVEWRAKEKVKQDRKDKVKEEKRLEKEKEKEEKKMDKERGREEKRNSGQKVDVVVK